MNEPRNISIHDKLHLYQPTLIMPMEAKWSKHLGNIWTLSYNFIFFWVKVWLGGATKNTFKGQSRNKNWPNNILGLTFFFKSYIYFMFIYCMPNYMAWSFHYNKKGENHYKFVFLIDVAPLGIKFLNFENS